MSIPSNDSAPSSLLAPDQALDQGAILASFEQTCREVVDHVPDIVYRLDGDGNIVFISEAVRKYGYDPAVLIGCSIFDLVHPQDRDRARFRINERRTGDRSTKSLQVRLLTADDASVPFELRDSATQLLVHAQGIYDGDRHVADRFLYTQGVARDISERCRLEGNLAQTRARFEERLEAYAQQLRDAYQQLQEKARLQEREVAQRQVLQQLRDAIWRMADSAGIEGLLRILHDGLTQLGIDHHGITINCLDASARPSQTTHYFLWPQDKGGPLTSVDSERDRIVHAIVDGGTITYRPDLEAIDEAQEMARLRQAWRAPVRCVLDLPFKGGTLALNSLVADAYDPDCQQFLVEVSRVFEEGLARVADLEVMETRQQEAEMLASERQRALERLERSQDRYRSLVENLPIGVTHTTPDHCILYANPYVRNLFDYSDQEWSRLVAADLYEDPADLAQLTSTLSRDGVASFEYAMRRKNGERLWVRGTTRLWRNPVTGKQEHHGVLEDITQARQRDDEYRHLEDQLRQAQRMEVVGQLTAGIAHNFNNMLQGISGNLQLALLDAPESLQTMLLDADRVTYRAAQMVQQLVVFSSHGTHQGAPANIRRQRLAPIISDALEVCRRSLDHRIQLRDSLPPDLEVMADATLLQQVVLNLLVNARDAIEDGGVQQVPTIKVQAQVKDFEPQSTRVEGHQRVGRFICLEVIDNGVGMDDDVRRRIFEPFFSTKSVDRGTGLGLATVYGIVSQHSGWIECDSALGQGTRLRVYLPADEPVALPQAVPTATASPVTTSKRTLLIIDDEDMVRDTTASLLERAGFGVLTAASGERGLEIYAAGADEIDLVLLDLSMPTMSGHEVLLRLRQLNADVKALILTGYAIGDVNFAADVMHKPFTIAELLAKVEALLH